MSEYISSTPAKGAVPSHKKTNANKRTNLEHKHNYSELNLNFNCLYETPNKLPTTMLAPKFVGQPGQTLNKTIYRMIEKS